LFGLQSGNEREKKAGGARKSGVEKGKEGHVNDLIARRIFTGTKNFERIIKGKAMKTVGGGERGTGQARWGKRDENVVCRNLNKSVQKGPEGQKKKRSGGGSGNLRAKQTILVLKKREPTLRRERRARGVYETNTSKGEKEGEECLQGKAKNRGGDFLTTSEKDPKMEKKQTSTREYPWDLLVKQSTGWRRNSACQSLGEKEIKKRVHFNNTVNQKSKTHGKYRTKKRGLKLRRQVSRRLFPQKGHGVGSRPGEVHSGEFVKR